MASRRSKMDLGVWRGQWRGGRRGRGGVKYGSLESSYMSVLQHHAQNHHANLFCMSAGTAGFWLQRCKWQPNFGGSHLQVPVVRRLRSVAPLAFEMPCA